MNIDCIANEIEIYSKCLQSFRLFNLGSERFLNSVMKVTIDYRNGEDKPDVYEDLELICEYFNNLSSVNLKNLKYLSISEIVKFNSDSKKGKITSIKSQFKHYYDFTVSSKAGYALLYDSKGKYIIKFTDLSLTSLSKN